MAPQARPLIRDYLQRLPQDTTPELQILRFRGLFGTMGPAANTRDEQHPDLAPRREDLSVMSRAADELRGVSAGLARRARQERSHIRVHRNRRLLLQDPHLQPERAL